MPRRYVEASDVVELRVRELCTTANDRVLTLLTEWLDLESLAALNRERPDIINQREVLFVLAKRFEVPSLRSFEELLKRRPLTILWSFEGLKKEIADSCRIDDRVQELTKISRRVPADPQKYHHRRQDLRTAIYEALLELVRDRRHTEALLIFDCYSDLLEVEADEHYEKLIPPLLCRSALRTGDPTLYQETFDLVNQHLMDLRLPEFMLQSLEDLLKPCAVRLKNAFYDRDLIGYLSSVWWLVSEEKFAMLINTYPILVPLSLLSDSNIWIRFIGKVRQFVPNYKVDYRSLSPKIREGVGTAIIEAQGLTHVLATLEELGFFSKR